MTVIEQRHPDLGRLMALWCAERNGDAPPPASALGPDRLAELAALTVLITRCDNGGGHLTIESSGERVDAIYGAPLAGAPAERLAPWRGDAELEARSAIESAQPVLVEDELREAGRRQRVARLYLPLANDDGTPDRVLCGVVAMP